MIVSLRVLMTESLLSAAANDGFRVLISFSTKEEADVAASALRADGVHAFVGNEHHAHMEWWAVTALGGVQLMVPSQRLPDAKRLLHERLAAWADAGAEQCAKRRDHWKAWTMLAWLFWPLVVVLGIWLLALLWPGIAGWSGLASPQPGQLRAELGPPQPGRQIGGADARDLAAIHPPLERPRSGSRSQGGIPFDNPEEALEFFERMNAQHGPEAYSPPLPRHYGD